MLGEVIRAHSLQNGLKINVIDASKKIAGDRYQVVLILRMDIPVHPYLADVQNFTDIDVASLKAAVGDRVIFEKKAERNFIDQQEKDSVFEALETSLLATTLKYCGHADFPAKFILKKYLEK